MLDPEKSLCSLSLNCCGCLLNRIICIAPSPLSTTFRPYIVLKKFNKTCGSTNYHNSPISDRDIIIAQPYITAHHHIAHFFCLNQHFFSIHDFTISYVPKLNPKIISSSNNN